MMVKSILDNCKKLFVLVFLTSTSFSQNNTSFEKFSTEQGLSQNSIMRILQDSRGFLWFGTFDGLNRYDGYQFKIFRNIPGDSTSLSNNNILSICEDNSSNIWIGTMGGGLNKYNRDKDNFIHYSQVTDDSTSISDNFVRTIIEDHQGKLWIGTNNGLNIFDPKTEQFARIFSKNQKNTIATCAAHEIAWRSSWMVCRDDGRSMQMRCVPVKVRQN